MAESLGNSYAPNGRAALAPVKLALAKQQPGKLSYAATGRGTLPSGMLGARDAMELRDRTRVAALRPPYY
jgi:hypothetical protein